MHFLNEFLKRTIGLKSQMINMTNNLIFFFNSQHRKQRLRSIPLHSLNNYDLNYLEKIINEFKLHSNLTINFVGFTDLKWPKSNQLIQRKRDLLE